MDRFAHTHDQLAAANLMKLPNSCYALIPERPPGQRIVVIRAGCCSCLPVPSLDDPTKDAQQLQHLVAKLNQRLLVSAPQAEAMRAGALLGWHVRAADPDTYSTH